jgi:hypothetical protein
VQLLGCQQALIQQLQLALQLALACRVSQPLSKQMHLLHPFQV